MKWIKSSEQPPPFTQGVDEFVFLIAWLPSKATWKEVFWCGECAKSFERELLVYFDEGTSRGTATHWMIPEIPES